MQRNRAVYAAKCAVVLSIFPAILLSYIGGPDPRKTGAPGDQTCAECHTGTAVNANGNKIELTFEGGDTYVPGVKQRIRLRITEPNVAYGFQMTARPVSNLERGQAGRFEVAEAGTMVLCENNTVRDAGNCPAALPIEFIEHNMTKSVGEWVMDWMPPSTDIGDVRFYVAGNASNGNRSETSGDRIYTANFTLRPAASGGTRPSISQGGVGDAFNGQAGLTTSGWTSVFGQNFSTSTMDWSSAPEFAQGRLPLSLGGVSVTVNNKPAPIYFISPGQINFIGPTDDSTGDVQVVVTTREGASAPVIVRKNAVLPSVYAPFGSGGRLFATVVENATGALLGKTGVDPRVTRGVRPGDIIQIYSSGLGPTNPAVEADRVPAGTPLTVSTPIVRIGDVQLEVFGAALTFPALYQIGARVPQTVQAGDQPITIEIQGVRSPSTVFIPVER